MRLSIHHETAYRYTAPAHYSIQQLRLTPRSEPHQRVLSWRIEAPGRLQRFTDAYGNITHTMVLTAPHDSIRVVVAGTVEIDAPQSGRGDFLPDPGIDSDLSPLVFSVATPLTEAEETVRAFAAIHLRQKARAEDFLGLAGAICGTVEYQSGITEVTSTAAQALDLGRGVCQDHAHLFIACCRARGVPARYVSGYVDPGHDEEAASHAWADVWVEGDGWVSVDITHRVLARERHCRLAVGRDYLSAAPVRGVRTGGGDESLHVEVSVRSSQ
jgi:transglutaminase-like putative cysteine protease